MREAEISGLMLIWCQIGQDKDTRIQAGVAKGSFSQQPAFAFDRSAGEMNVLLSAVLLSRKGRFHATNP